jgi:PAS domain S-box-containing protein
MPTDDAGAVPDTPAAMHFHFLPAYARYLLEHKLHEFTLYTIEIARKQQIPLLRYLEGLSEERLIAVALEGNIELLTALANNEAVAYVEKSLASWRENRLLIIQGNDIVIEDISKINFVRRQGFRKMLPAYSSDNRLYVSIMEELDQFILMHEDISYKMLFEMKEAKIQEHHHFIDKINNASPGVIYVYDPVTKRQIYSNHKGEELLGYTREDMDRMGDNLLDTLIHPGDHEVLAAHITAMRSMPDGATRTVEYRMRNKHGHYVWQRAYETVFRRAADGTPVEIIGIAIDITHEKNATAQLEQREQQLREAQEIAGIGSFEWDLVGDESVLSPQLLRIFEMERKSSLPDFLQYVHPADRESVKQSIADALAGRADYECEYRYRRNGPEKVIWSRGKVVFENGRPVKMKGTVMDVSLRHDMVKRLARSEQLHKQAQALTHLGNWSWSLFDDKVVWSDEMYHIFGLPEQSEDMTFDRVEQFVHPDEREALRQKLRNALTTGVAEDYIVRIITPDGATKYVEGKTEVLTDEEGVPYKIAGTCQDVTEHHLLNERLKEQNRALERSNQELTAFNYIASHDLKEPVRKIKIFSNLIVDNEAEPLLPKQKETMGRIITATEHMERLIEALIVFSRTNAEQRRFEEVDLAGVVSEIELRMKDRIDESGAMITVGKLPKICAIPFQIQQLFENLIGNALKYSKPGEAPRIQIHAQQVRGSAIGDPGADMHRLYHKISLSDNGIGFEQQYASKIFEVFQRLHGKESYSGTGIGLAICKKIVENHNGFITASGQPGAGATFNIYLPADER